MFVFPSAYEGFGLPILEAMMAWVPVITSQSAALAEITGEFTFNLASISTESIKEKILYVHALSENEKSQHTFLAKKWAQIFTWQRSAQQLNQIVRSVRSNNAVC